LGPVLGVGASAHCVSANRLGNVLELSIAPVFKVDIYLTFNFGVNFSRNQDAPRIGHALQACGDVDAVAVHITLMVNVDIAKVDPNPELDRKSGRGKLFLNFNAASHGFHGAGKLCQHPIAGSLNEAALVPGQRRFDYFSPEATYFRISRLLGLLHEGGVANHVGRQNGC
jgi:hypothetical protein